MTLEEAYETFQPAKVYTPPTATPTPSAPAAPPVAVVIGPTAAEAERLEEIEDLTAMMRAVNKVDAIQAEAEAAAPSSAVITDEEELDEVMPIEDFEEACDILEQSFAVFDDLINGLLMDSVHMPTDMIIRIEDMSQSINKFLNLYMEFNGAAKGDG